VPVWFTATSSPTNLMFDARGGLKIVDFGIARLAQTAAARLTATKTVIGSAPYLSPEQLTGRPADERSELYALGCIMTTMLTGRPPFEGEHPLALVHQHVNAAPPQLSERRPGINPALEALVAQLLSKSPQDVRSPLWQCTTASGRLRSVHSPSVQGCRKRPRRFWLRPPGRSQSRRPP
jgi:serine/threonine protein kinase